jgi:glycine/D-amino acid oxidase-like deaminating enzyme
MGVHIIQNCEVTGVRRADDGSVSGVDTSRGFIGAKKVGVVAAGHTSVIMEMAGVRMPLESYPLQALVSEPVKPVFPCVVMSNTVHALDNAEHPFAETLANLSPQRRAADVFDRVVKQRRDRFLFVAAALENERRDGQQMRDVGDVRSLAALSAMEPRSITKRLVETIGHEV